MIIGTSDHRLVEMGIKNLGHLENRLRYIFSSAKLNKTEN